MNTPPHILIVEDDDFLRTLAYNKLIQSGFIVTTASDGSQGLTKILSNTYDVIILDLMLPIVDGIHILEDLKRSHDLEKQHIIVFSNLGSEEDIKKVTEYGITDYMIKSNFTLDELVERINRIIEKNASTNH